MTDLVQGNGPALDISTMRCQCTAEDLLAGLVETLYAMRNALLHGEVDPDEQVLACYEPAYRIVMCFLERIRRSEEHTSELQSLMRISYAVFCLKKKT